MWLRKDFQSNFFYRTFGGFNEVVTHIGSYIWMLGSQIVDCLKDWKVWHCWGRCVIVGGFCGFTSLCQTFFSLLSLLSSFSPLSSLSSHATYQSWIRCKFSAATTKNACCYVPHHGDHRLTFWNYEQNDNQLNVFFHQLPWSLCLFTAIKMENDYHRQVGTIIIWFMENEANIYSFRKKNLMKFVGFFFSGLTNWVVLSYWLLFSVFSCNPSCFVQVVMKTSAPILATVF